jgi:hypothetical protein
MDVNCAVQTGVEHLLPVALDIDLLLGEGRFGLQSIDFRLDPVLPSFLILQSAFLHPSGPTLGLNHVANLVLPSGTLNVRGHQVPSAV